MAVLGTKLHVPATRRPLVARPRLTELVRSDASELPRLVLISAPAGFGKTTLLSQWLSPTRPPACGRRLHHHDRSRHAGYLLIMCTTFVSAYVLPSIAETDPTYVEGVIAVATGDTATGDIGALETINQVQGFAYLAGGLIFGIALYRARVLARHRDDRPRLLAVEHGPQGRPDASRRGR